MAMKSCSHLPAFFSTASAGSRALLAVIGIVLGALFRASCTGFGTHRAELRGKGRASCHFPGGERAEVRAAPVQADTLRHHLDVLLGKARTGAVFAGQGTGLAGVDTFLMIIHGFLIWLRSDMKRTCRLHSDDAACMCRLRSAVCDQRFIFACSSADIPDIPDIPGMLSWVEPADPPVVQLVRNAAEAARKSRTVVLFMVVGWVGFSCRRYAIGHVIREK